MEESKPSLDKGTDAPLPKIKPKKKRKLNLVEIDIETPTVVDNSNNEHKTREKLKEINDEIDLRVVKKRKLIDPEKFKQILDEKRKKKVEELLSIKSSECHFCFNNPKVASHMLISIAENSYITLAKGPVSVPNKYIRFPGHVIITPIEHKPKLSDYSIESNITEQPVYKELLAYEHSISDMYAKVEMGTVFFDFNMTTGVHYHIQCVPVPVQFISKVSKAIDRQYKFQNKKAGEEVMSKFKKYVGEDDQEYKDFINDKTQNFIQFKIMNTRKKCEIYVSTFDPTKRIDMQFGRSVMAYVLNQPKRVYWNNEVCQETEKQEKKNVELFQMSYNDFDIV